MKKGQNDQFPTFRSISVYSIPTKLSVVKLGNASSLDILDT